MKSGRSLLPKPSPFRLRLAMMLNGSPLLNCRSIAIWLLFRIAASTPLVVCTVGLNTMLPLKLWRMSIRFGPMSRSRFVGSLLNASLTTPSADVPGKLTLSGALSSPFASVYERLKLVPCESRRHSIRVSAL